VAAASLKRCNADPIAHFIAGIKRAGFLPQRVRASDAAVDSRYWRLQRDSLQYSLRRGRLLIYLACDDVVYMLDGLRRLDIVDRSGILAFFLNWRQHPPHAPLSTLLALLSFLLLGVHDWAPYAANRLIVLTMVPSPIA
jgi:hypothetical protein